VKIQYDTVVRRNEEVIFAALGDEGVTLNAETGNYHYFSDVGTRIWALLDTPTSAVALSAELVEEFAVDPDICRAAVVEFLEKLADRGLVHVVP
jgi:hypothetical protein